MEIEFDTAKSEKNRNERGFGFEIASGLDWDTALTLEDERAAYSEPRFVTFGFIDARLYVLVWTPRAGKLRVISLRKANKREIGRYEKN